MADENGAKPGAAQGGVAAGSSGTWARVFEGAGWGIALVSPTQGTIEAMNPELVRMHGGSEADLLGRSPLDLVAPADRKRVASEVALAQQQGRHSFETEQLHHDGGTFPVLIDITTIKRPSGEVRYRAFHIQDLSERKRREDELRAASISLDVLASLLEGCQVIGFDYRYLYVNDELVAQARMHRDDLLGQTMMDCYPGIEKTPMFAMLERCMAERQPGEMEDEFTFPDGSRGFFELRFIPIPPGVCILSRDITERRHQLSAIVNDSDDAIIGRTLDGVITSWNKSAERIFGYSSREMIGHGMHPLLPDTLASEEEALIAQIRRGKQLASFETVRRHKDGREIDVSVSLSPIRDARGSLAGISMIARDVTDLKRMVRELTRAKETAESAVRELEAFSYAVSHDLRGPLRGIDGFSQALLEDYPEQLDAKGKRYLGWIRSGVQKMGLLIDDLLRLSRVSRSDLRRGRVDLSHLASEIIEELLRDEPGRQVDAIVEPNLTAEGDPRLLRIALENLLANALKFSSRNECSSLEFGQRTNQSGTAFFVRDNGVGFDMSMSHKLFAPFQRLHSESEFPGTGIGLATVQRVVHRHGGRVWVEASPDEGACFFFTLGPAANSQMISSR